MSTYAGNPRGAEWNKWDLHVHTPVSVEQHYGDGQQAVTWDAYIAALAALPREIRAIGINDYFTIEGYRRVLAARDGGRLPNLDLILPVIELRLNIFAGHTDLSKLNLHVVFSDELPPDKIEQFFLQRLCVKFRLGGNEDWAGCVGSREGLVSLGEAVHAATPHDRRTKESALRIGFRSATVELDDVYALLDDSVFKGRHLTALGLGEWSQMRWDGAGSAQKRNAIERADFVLTASPSAALYQDRRAQLIRHEVNPRLFDASDAHYYADASEPNRLSQTLCWIKSDVTFRGLRRAIRRFDERVFVGDSPPKLAHVDRNKTKYIDRLQVRRNPGSGIQETWFDMELRLNNDLVALIGNQGNGKSALTDVLALCGNSKVAEDFGFLNPTKFCDRQKKAHEFTATLTWRSGEVITRRLDEQVDPVGVERVRYVPQGFFDKVTNEVEVSEGGRFYSEIRKTVFSHIPLAERLGCTNLDDLVAEHTKAATAGLAQLRQEMSEINRWVVQLETASGSDEIKRLQAQIEQKEREIAVLTRTPPALVSPPAESSEANDQIEQLRKEESHLSNRVVQTETTLALLKRQRATLQNVAQALTDEERRIRTRIEQLVRDLRETGLKVDMSRALVVKRDPQVLQEELQRVEATIDAATNELDSAIEQSLAARVQALRSQRTALEAGLQQAAAAYQAYRQRLAEWEAKVLRLTGATESPAPDSLQGLQAQLEDLRVTKPAEIQSLEHQRNQKCREIHANLLRLAQVYQTLTRPVQEHIAREQLTRERYRMTFEVVLAENGLADQLFSLVSQSGGPFAGQQAGRDRLRQLVSEAEFATADGALAFAEHIVNQLRRMPKSDPAHRNDFSGLLKKGMTREQVYDLLFSLEYISPTFALALNGKPLQQLSPGERGILLLVFYLVVDRGEEPLIIDQPEGNLNNQSIVEHLVPVFLAAKGRRQVIIVTHNPNLAIVCDAEQIIHCELDAADSFRLRYESGAVENPKFNKLSIDLLEGTAVAFEARRETYDPSQSQSGGVIQLPVFPWSGLEPPPVPLPEFGPDKAGERASDPESEAGRGRGVS